MTARTRKPDWRLSAPIYPCGHPRTPENTRRGRECRTCDNARAARARQRNRRAARDRASWRESHWQKRYGRSRTWEIDRVATPAMPRPRRAYLVHPNFAAILAEVRPQYEAAIRDLEWGSSWARDVETVLRDSTDDLQANLFDETTHVREVRGA